MISFDQTLMITMSKAYKPLHMNLNNESNIKKLTSRIKLRTQYKELEVKKEGKR